MSAPQSNAKFINLTEYSLPQLEQLLQTLLTQRDQFLKILNTMKDTNTKASKALDALKCMKPGNEENEILIPVSADIMVPGKFNTSDHVYVSVGASYVVEKSVEDANKFFTNQTTLLESNIKTYRSQAMSLEDQIYSVQKLVETRKLQQQQQALGVKQ